MFTSVVDMDKDKCGKTYNGYTIMSLDDIKNDIDVIVSSNPDFIYSIVQMKPGCDVIAI